MSHVTIGGVTFVEEVIDLQEALDRRSMTYWDGKDFRRDHVDPDWTVCVEKPVLIGDGKDAGRAR